ncbi:response regulator [Terasakiella sp. SH-1]|uniref:response regulator n=1 Tax=Terasakiella sp. SH-1 TaxID=2560057 RepID=UPI001073B729|nr:response regulator [Terasakiella sp. SH-1]
MALVLIVEDEADVREDVVDFLELNDFDTVEAVDGRDGLAKAVEHQPDIIVSDLSMPNMDGTEFFESLKNNHPEVAGIPFLFLTASTARENELRAKELGANDFLTKPIDFEILLATIKAQLKATERSIHSINLSINDFFQKLEAGGTTQLSKNKQAQLQSIVDRHKDLMKKSSRPVAAIQKLKNAEYHIQTIDDAENVALTMSHFFPEPENALLGLNELLVNAIEHGNLGITYDDKGDLLENGEWVEECERRLQQDKYKDRVAVCTFRRLDDCLEVEIIDEGDGFNWQKYTDFSPERMAHTHGRGIMLSMHMAFNEVEYKGKGNHVVARTFIQ